MTYVRVNNNFNSLLYLFKNSGYSFFTPVENDIFKNEGIFVVNNDINVVMYTHINYLKLEDI